MLVNADVSSLIKRREKEKDRTVWQAFKERKVVCTLLCSSPLTQITVCLIKRLIALIDL